MNAGTWSALCVITAAIAEKKHSVNHSRRSSSQPAGPAAARAASHRHSVRLHATKIAMKASVRHSAGCFSRERMGPPHTAVPGR